MSSHHFVTEDQEPVLVFDNGPYCSMELMGQLLEWSPKVITLGDAGYRLTEMGVKVDIMICNEAPMEDFVQLYHPLTVIVTEDHCFNRCIKYLQHNAYHNAHFLWINDAPAFEQLLFDLEPEYHFVMWNDSYKAFAISGKFEKYYPAGTGIKLNGSNTASGDIGFGEEIISDLQEINIDEAGILKVNMHSGRVVLKEFSAAG